MTQPTNTTAIAPVDSLAATPTASVQVAALAPSQAAHMADEVAGAPSAPAAHGPSHEGHYTVTVHAPAKGMRAYLVGPGAQVALEGIDLNTATSRVEGGNLRITTSTGGEILLLDFVAGAHSARGVSVITGQGALPGTTLLAALDHGTAHEQHAHQKMVSKNGDDCGAILVHHHHKLVAIHTGHHAHHTTHHTNPCLPEMMPAEGPAEGPQGGDGGFLVPTINGDVFGVAGLATVGVIAPFAMGFTTDHIQYTQYLTFPNGTPNQVTPPPPVNNVIANPDSATIHCMVGNSVNIAVLSNDFDPQGDAFSITSFTQPAHGTVTENANGTFTYTQTVAFLGADTYTYTITDSKGATSTTTVTVNIVDQPPVANADATTTAYQTPVTTTVLANDTDPDGDMIHVVSAGNGAHGTTHVNADGTITYTPAAGFSGTDTYQYTIADDCGLTSTTTVTVTIGTPPFNNVIANPDSATIHCMVGNSVNIAVLANDVDPQGDAFSITSFTQPAHGTVTENANGTFTYTQTTAFLGADTYTYTITDSKGATSTTTVTVNIVDQPPVANADVTTTAYQTPVTTTVLANDTDPDGDTIHIVSAGNGAHGTTHVNADGTITYTPAAGFSGTDTYQYTIADDCGLTSTTTVTVTIGTPPFNNVIANPDSATIHCMVGNSVNIAVLANDVDPQGDAFSITSFTQPAHGTVTENANGTFTYTQTTAFLGADTYTYTITDSKGATSTTTVTVNIVDQPPVANADVTTTAYQTPVTTTVLANDTDPDGDTIHIVSAGNGAHGTTHVNADGTITYTPAAGFSGTDTYQYTIADDCGLTSTTTVTVTIGTPPFNNVIANPDQATIHCMVGNSVVINELANDVDPQGDAFHTTSFTQPTYGHVVLNADGTFTYTETAAHLGDDTFQYTITDSKGATSTTTVTVHIVDQPPVANADVCDTGFNTPVLINVLANDTDPDGDAIHIVSAGNGAHGTTQIVNGQVLYIPAFGFTGTDTFTYTIADDCGLTSTTTVTVTVGNAPPPADVLIANPDNATVHCGSAATISVLGNDTDSTGEAFHISAFTQPAHGVITENADGTFHYQSSGMFLGADTFTYTITDASGSVSTTTVTVNVVDQPPVAVADVTTTAYGAPVTTTVLANDSDPDGDAIHVVSATNGAHGTTHVNADGSITYTPAAGFTGTDTYQYTIADDCGETSTTTVTVGVGTPPVVVNHPPVANPDTCGVQYGNVVQLPNLLANDSDPDGDPIHLVSLNGGSTSTAHGIIFQDSNGNYYYQPLQNGTYDDVISYTIADSHGATATSTLDIHVTSGSYSFTAAGGTCPLTIDLGGDGITLVSGTESNASFDLNGTGVATHTAWVGSAEGILAIDRNGNGTIDGINEVFSGFTQLAQQEDSNHDGVIDARDADWNNLKVWVDTNGDGVSQPGELHTLSSLGIESIDVTNVNSTNGAMGNGSDAYINALSVVHMADGSIRTIGEVFFNNDATSTASTTATSTAAANTTVTTAATTTSSTVTTDTSHTAGTTGSSLADLVAAAAAVPVPHSTAHEDHHAVAAASVAAPVSAVTDASSIVLHHYTLEEHHQHHVVA